MGFIIGISDKQPWKAMVKKIRVVFDDEDVPGAGYSKC